MADDPILHALAQKKADRYAERISKTLKLTAKKVERELEGVRFPGDDAPVFALFVFAGGAAQYIGNGQREDIKRIVASVLHRWDSEPGMHKPHHEKTDEEKAQERDNPL